MNARLTSPAILITAVGPGWTEAPYAQCGDCRLVFDADDLAYTAGADDWLCATCRPCAGCLAEPGEPCDPFCLSQVS